MFKKINVLWVEDNIGDILLIKEAFIEAGLNFDLTILDNGKNASDYLNRRGKYKNVYMPELLILDLKLPEKNGHQLLNEIKFNPRLNSIPVVVLTDLEKENNILNGCEPSRCLYLTKGASFFGLVDMARQIEEFLNLAGHAL